MNKTYYIPQIQEMAKDIPVGVSERFLCPVCNGGSDKERSLSITRRSQTEASFNCFRNKCNLNGGHVALFSGTEGQILKHNSNRTSNNDLVRNLTGLDTDTVEFFMKRYNMTPAMLHYGRFQTTFDRRVYMWIFSPHRLKRGGSVRKYKELYVGRREYASIPKTMMHYNGTDNVALSWYYKGRGRRKSSDTLVIVEDIVSALRLIPYVDSVSLLGTGLGYPKQSEIRRLMYDRVVLALDEDATAKALRIKKDTRLVIPNMEVMYLDKDIKDQTPEELEEKLNVYSIL